MHCAGDAARGPSSPFLNKAGQAFKVPPLQLSPAPSATALDLRGLSGHMAPLRDADSNLSDAVTGREPSFGSLAGGQDAASSLSAHGSRPPTGFPHPLNNYLYITITVVVLLITPSFYQ